MKNKVNIKLFWHKLICPEEGIALMMTLWIMVLLIAIVTEFTHATRSEINTTKNFKEEIESYYLAQAGMNLAITEILQDAEFHSIDKEGEIVFGRKNINKPIDEEKNDTTGSKEKETVSEDIDPFESIGAKSRKNIELGNGSFSYSIKDDNGRLNLNIIPRETIIKILAQSGVEAGELRDTIADSILDWRDKDNLHHFNGAEDDYYLALPEPYECKDDLFGSVEELLRVKGMTKEILYGTKNTNKNKESDDYLGIYDILTVQNIEFINPNTADERVLKILYPEDKVEVILSARMQKGRYDTSISSHFIVESTGFLNNSPGKRVIKATFEKIGHDTKSFILTKYWNNNKTR